MCWGAGVVGWACSKEVSEERVKFEETWGVSWGYLFSLAPAKATSFVLSMLGGIPSWKANTSKEHCCC
jgi:hypothetical protein